MKFVFRDYKGKVDGFEYAPMQYPVIILIDNDDGAKPVFNMIKEKFDITVTMKTNAPFYHICHNLYLVKTSEIGKNGKSCIEDFFDKSVRDKKLDGKTFNANKTHDAEGEYGKAAFADHVVRPNAARIDFSKFSQILDRIVATVNDYKLKTPGPNARVSGPSG